MQLGERCKLPQRGPGVVVVIFVLFCGVHVQIC